jgi:mono/diheme cytochrome c family protein
VNLRAGAGEHPRTLRSGPGGDVVVLGRHPLTWWGFTPSPKGLDMKRIAIALLAFAVAGTAFADGAATYASKCAICHGKAGEGSKIVQKSIAGTPADKVKKAITEGTGKMKPVKIENADEVATFVAAMKK